LSLKNSPFKVEVGPFKKTITIPTSKSHANRILILAALCKEEVIIKNLPSSSDVSIMIACLKKIGLMVEEKANEVRISNSFPACEKRGDIIRLDTGDGGTTNRFLWGLLARGKNKYLIEADAGFKKRPQDDLLDALKILGVKILDEKDCWFSLQGPMTGEKQASLEVDCAKSTQFASSLLMATYDIPITVKEKNLETSELYLAMTKDYIEKIKKGERSFTIPVDFSSASYPLALAALTGEVTIKNALALDPYQADGELVTLLKKMGAKVELSSEGLHVGKTKLNAISIDAKSFPDLVPTLMFLCSYAEGESKISNVKVLRHKESDRLEEMFKILRLFKVSFSYDEKIDLLKIMGSSDLVEFVHHEPFPDHRMIMVTYLFMRKNSGGVVYNSSHVKKSFPDFFEVMA
jgi:3-phosphoshikimate 1-carboxyvinyltransferase